MCTLCLYANWFQSCLAFKSITVNQHCEPTSAYSLIQASVRNTATIRVVRLPALDETGPCECERTMHTCEKASSQLLLLLLLLPWCCCATAPAAEREALHILETSRCKAPSMCPRSCDKVTCQVSQWPQTQDTLGFGMAAGMTLRQQACRCEASVC